jgi:polyphosphate kinase 2
MNATKTVKPAKTSKSPRRKAQLKGVDSAARSRRDAKAPADTPEPMSGKDYEKALKKLHVELVKLQQWVVHKGLKVCILFEGRDGAGKGGTIKAITERVSPRVFRVVALPAPTEREKSQMYVQRYLPHLPAAGEVVIFDRSWYNRAGVERVMGFCTPEQVDVFLKMVPAVERAIVDSGVILLKYWLEVSPEEQTRRLKSRFEDGRKIWKLTPMDLRSYSRWYDYSRARDDMFAATDTVQVPWFVAMSDDKKKVRLNIISHLLKQVPYKELKREKIKLPARQERGDYRESNHPYKVIPESS